MKLQNSAWSKRTFDEFYEKFKRPPIYHGLAQKPQTFRLRFSLRNLLAIGIFNIIAIL